MLEITSHVLLLASVFSGVATTSVNNFVNHVINQNDNRPAIEVSLSETYPQTLEQHVKEYFKDTPILAEIAKCESTYRQLDSNGKVLKGERNRYDIGIMQINVLYHDEKATELGYDLTTVDGNLGFAKWLYDNYGVKPWMSSAKCWQNSITPDSDGQIARS